MTSLRVKIGKQNERHQTILTDQDRDCTLVRNHLPTCQKSVTLHEFFYFWLVYMSFFLAFDTYLHNIFTSYAPVSREISYTQRIGSKIIATFLQFFLFLICSAFTSFLFLMVSSFTNFLFIFLVCQNFNLLQKIISLRRVRSNTALSTDKTFLKVVKALL